MTEKRSIYEPTPRRPIGVALDPNEQGPQAESIVVCDDGSTWSYIPETREWDELAPIPGSKRDLDKQELAKIL